MVCTCRGLLMCVGVIGIAAIAGTIAVAQPAKDTKPGAAKPATPPDMPLPPGWTAEDMQCMIEAGTPGEMHAWMVKNAGTWHGTSKSWMSPGGEAMDTECTVTIAPIMDGRYLKTEYKCDMPGMGPYSGLGISGYDNVSQKFVGNWVDTMSTGIMNGVGEISKDNKTLSWTYTYNCPITKKQTTMRQIETYGENSMAFDVFATDPKTGKEYKCMRAEFTRKAK